MMRYFMTMLTLMVAPVLTAQEPERAVSDSARAARAEQLRAEIERRFGERVRDELGLTDDQAQKLKATHEKYGERRRSLLREQLDARSSLQRHMRPGEAADPDSVRVLMDRMQRGREQMFRLEQEEYREMEGYLTPVQRARYQMMRQRFLERVNEMRRERRMWRPGPGMRPEGRRTGPPQRRPPAQRP